MTCEDVRGQLLDLRRHRLETSDAEVRAHLRECTACAREDEADALLDDLLARQLPRHAAPRALKRRLGLIAAAAPAPSAGQPASWSRRAAPVLAACAAVFVAGVFTGRTLRGDAGALDRLAGEAIGDHLRVLVSEHPVEVASGGSHQVKPWFAGRLDFAPTVPDPDVPDLRLEGGSVGWFLDRRAAVLSYALRKHRVTLLAFRGDGVEWPGGVAPAAGGLREASLRGFHVVLWRSAGVGYALVSDVNAAELRDLARRFAVETGP